LANAGGVARNLADTPGRSANPGDRFSKQASVQRLKRFVGRRCVKNAALEFPWKRKVNAPSIGFDAKTD
jgi:hypothetical protein